MRGQIAGLSAAIAVIAGGGAAYVATHPEATRDGSPPATSTPSPSASASPATALSPLDSSADVPTRAAVTAVMRRAARDPAFGSALAALVVDADSGAVLFAHEADRVVAPASTAKLLTAAAALHVLGPDRRIPTTVFVDGSTVYLVGTGDVTLTSRPSRSNLGGGDLQTLARAAAPGLTTRRVHVRYDTSAWSGPTTAQGWSPAYLSGSDVARLSPLEVDEGRQSNDPHVPRVGDPALQAATAFAGALRAAGVRVAGSPLPATTPATARKVGSVSSPPVAALVQRMLVQSDNDLAEALARTVAARNGRPADFEGAAAATVAAVTALGVPTGGIELHDGSGLSRLDRVTPRALVALLNAAVDRDELRPLLTALPVAGLTGTLDDRYRNRVARVTAAGVVRAKTGTLLGVSALAGQVVDADGRLLLFALLTDRAADTARTERALDRAATALARCGCH